MGQPLSPLHAAALEPAPYGLLNSKTLVDERARWEGGFEQESEACNTRIRLLDICMTSVTASAVDPVGDRSLGEYRPFAVQTTVKCSTFGFKAHDYEKHAVRALEASQGKGVELEFWEGRLAQAATAEAPTDPNPNRYLASNTAVDVTPTAGTPIKVRYGLALLEGALADTGHGGPGFIHATREVASTLPVKDKDNDGVLTTTLGNYVVAGVGYTGTGPDGTMPSSGVWMYATGPVMVRLGEVSVTPDNFEQSVDSSVNTIEASAERPAAVVWDGCTHFAVLVDLSLDYA